MMNSPCPYHPILTLDSSPWITIVRTMPIQLLQPSFMFGALKSHLGSEAQVTCHMTAGQPSKVMKF